MFNCDSNLIDAETLALEAVFIGPMKSRIIRLDGIYYSKQTPMELLEKASLRNGSTKQGRIDAVKVKMKFMHRTPLMIIPYSVGAFPTFSSENISCVWIFGHPFQVRVMAKGKSKIILLNHEEIIVPVSKSFLLKQEQRLLSSLHMFGKLQETIHSATFNMNYKHKNEKLNDAKSNENRKNASKVSEKKMIYQLKARRKEDKKE